MTAWLERHRALVWVAAIGLALAGALLALRMPSGIYPEVEFSRIVVVARSGDAPPEVTQVVVGRPLEAAFSTVLGVQRVRSRAIRGAVELSLLFSPETDMWRALQLVESRVGDARAELPPDTEVVVERLTTTSFPVVTFNLAGNVDPRRLRELGEFVLKPALSRVRGVGRVEVLGGDVREVEVIVDPTRAAALRLSPSEIADRIRASSVLQAVGRFDEAHAMVTVMTSGEPRAASDLARLPVATGPDGSTVPLSAVASIEEGAEDRLLRVSGPAGETVLVSVSRLPGASTSDVVERVRAAIDMTKSALPPGVSVEPVYDQAELVRDSMRSVRDAILLGIALCMVVIAVFLGDLRTGVVAALAVPLTLAISFVPTALLGQSLNLMSLGGLAVAIGLVVDDAIVVVEAIRREMEHGRSVSDAARIGPARLLPALIGTTATTVIVFVPLAWLEGVVGRFFSALAATLSSAVVLSLAVAWLVVPPLAARAMRTGAPREEGPRYVHHYARALEASLRRPLLAVGFAVLLLGAGAWCVPRLATGFLPSMDEGAFVLDYFLPAGTSLADTDATARKIEAVLKSIPDVETYSRRTGAELGPATATQMNRGDIMVRLRPAGVRRSAEVVIADARRRVEAQVPEARVEFVQVLQDVLNDLSGAPRPVEIKLFGDDYARLGAIADSVAARIRDVPGLVDLYAGHEDEVPELRFRVDQVAAARLGKSAQEVAADLDASLHGVVPTTIRRPERPIGVRVRYPDAIRFDASEITRLPLLAGPRGMTSITAVTTPERGRAASVLVRENLRPVVILSADHEDRDLGSVVSDIRRRLAAVKLPEGYNVELGGQYEAQQQTFRELLLVGAFGLIAVLVVLLAQFRNARLALVVLSSVPLAVTGAIVTLGIAGVPLNASSLMGCVLLVGLVVKNGILLLEEAEAQCESGLPTADALVSAGALRLRPILMTTLATVAGLLPLALGIGAGSELQQPLAVTVIGGLAVSTLVSLFVVPSFARVVLPGGPA